MLILNSPSYIASLVQRPVKEVWTVTEALGIKPVAIINGVAHFDREQTEAIEVAFAAAAAEVASDE
jgi:hypothetical protein